MTIVFSHSGSSVEYKTKNSFIKKFQKLNIGKVRLSFLGKNSQPNKNLRENLNSLR